MASLKAEKPVCSQMPKEPAKAGDGASKAQASKPAPKKTEQKAQPKRKVVSKVSDLV